MGSGQLGGAPGRGRARARRDASRPVLRVSSLTPRPPFAFRRHRAGGGCDNGAALIIVLWISLGLTSIALHFSNAMMLEYRAADNAVAGVQAAQAIEGARGYLATLLASQTTPGRLPDTTSYRAEQAPVGEAYYWLVGRAASTESSIALGESYVSGETAGSGQTGGLGQSSGLENTAAPTDFSASQTDVTEVAFGLIDEASKLNLNTATYEMLEWLPGMTPELASAILDWRDENEEPEPDGAESDTYLLLEPRYYCKNADFETIEELRLVNGALYDLLYGEDANQNGVLDPNEDDGDDSPPSDNADGILDCGLLEYLTVYSREPNTRADGSARINVSSSDGRTQLTQLLTDTFDSERANEILSLAGFAQSSQRGGSSSSPRFGSVLEFYQRSGMTPDEFAEIYDALQLGPLSSSGSGSDSGSGQTFVKGLINVNTASEAVLKCVPGIGEDFAGALVAYRQSYPSETNTLAWVANALDEESVRQAGPYLTTRSYQYTADIAAVGRHGRGFRRVKLVIDTAASPSGSSTDSATGETGGETGATDTTSGESSTGGVTPSIVYRRDVTRLGWPLGAAVRQALWSSKQESNPSS